MMKYLLVISFLSFLVSSFAQGGFRLIRKAENKIGRGQYERAMKLLEKADSASYGFCGNAWIDAHETIILNKLKIYDAANDQASAVTLLNQIVILWKPNQDSLKMAYFIRLFDKEIIRHELDSVINTYTYDNHFFEQELLVQFTFFEEPYRLSSSSIFRIVEQVNRKIHQETKASKNEILRRVIREQPFYLLLID
ncbi:MAG: hypothetical protein KF704_03710 [Crocinitomicaceae bacterium]|nr:hypothetical protein [Crocinitomicaceae bacterium]